MEFPIDRVMRPVMNSLRADIEINPFTKESGRLQSAKPLPMKDRPLDNEYVWKGNPYQLDGWLKPTVIAMAFSADDPNVAWFIDAGGRLYGTLDGGQKWANMSVGMMGATVQGIAASPTRTFVIWAQTSAGVLISRDGGMTWRTAPVEDQPSFVKPDFKAWVAVEGATLRVSDNDELVRSTDGGATAEPAMKGWRIPKAKSILKTPWGIIASGPGGVYRTSDGLKWEELKFFREQETGPADYLHAYWMGRYYGFLPNE